MKVRKQQFHHQLMGLLSLGPRTASDGIVLFVSVLIKSLFFLSNKHEAPNCSPFTATLQMV